MNRYRLLAKVMALVLLVVLVLGAVPVAVAAANPVATISPASHVFPSAVVGYDEQPAQTLTITNTGDVNLYPLIGSGWSGPFTGDGWSYGAFIKPGESLTFDLRPDTNLPVGTHTGGFMGWFVPASDLDELDRIHEGVNNLFRSYVARYLGVAQETVDSWSNAELDAFWIEHGDSFSNSPIDSQWDASQNSYWRSAGRIELRAALSFTVTATPPIAVPDDDTSENIAHHQHEDTATTATPGDDVGDNTEHCQYDDINENSLNINLNPPTGR